MAEACTVIKSLFNLQERGVIKCKTSLETKRAFKSLIVQAKHNREIHINAKRGFNSEYLTELDIKFIFFCLLQSVSHFNSNYRVFPQKCMGLNDCRLDFKGRNVA